MRFSAHAEGQSFIGLAEQTTVATDATGGFIYGFTEKYSANPNVQATAFAAGTPLPVASMAVTNALTPTIGTLTLAASTVGGTSYPNGYVSGKVYGAAGVTVVGVNVISLTTLTASVNVQLMILGA